MNDIDNMNPACHDCPYWESCEPPYVCKGDEDKQMDVGIVLPDDGHIK